MADNFDFDELEKILERVREEQQANAEVSQDAKQEPVQNDAFEPLEPPKTKEQMRAEMLHSKPPEPEKKKSPKPKKAPKPAKPKKEKAEKKQIKMPKVNVNTDVIKANFKTRLLPAVKKAFGKVFTKKLAYVLIAVAVIAGVIFGGIKIYDYSKVAYLKPYIQKYGVDYPEGIRKEFCDAYGMDRKAAGALVFDDLDKEISVGGSAKNGAGVMEFGSTVLEDQHLRSVALDSSELEEYYSTAKAYTSASQRIVFKTLFEDEEYQVIAAYYANTNPDNDNGYVFPYNSWGNLTERSFKSYIDRVGTRSLYLTDVKTDYSGYYLSVNMPTDKQPDSRFVLLCKRVDGKDSFNKIKKTKQNRRIRQTQAWYDKHKQKNPYTLAAKWYPQIYTDKKRTKTQQLTAEDFKA